MFVNMYCLFLCIVHINAPDAPIVDPRSAVFNEGCHPLTDRPWGFIPVPFTVNPNIPDQVAQYQKTEKSGEGPIRPVFPKRKDQDRSEDDRQDADDDPSRVEFGVDTGSVNKKETGEGEKNKTTKREAWFYCTCSHAP